MPNNDDLRQLAQEVRDLAGLVRDLIEYFKALEAQRSPPRKRAGPWEVMKAGGRRRAWTFLAALFLTTAGCMVRTNHGSEAHYGAAPWVVYSLIGAGIVMPPLGGLALWLKGPVGRKLLGVGLLTLGPALCWLSAWAAASQYAVVADDRLEFKSGAAGRVQVLRFEDCRAFEFETRQVPGDRGRPEESTTPVATLKDGRRMDLGYPVLRGPVLDDLVERLRKAGVPVSGDRRGL